MRLHICSLPRQPNLSYVRKLGIKQSGDSRFGRDVEETPRHFPKECEALIHKRRKRLDAYQLLEENPFQIL